MSSSRQLTKTALPTRGSNDGYDTNGDEASASGIASSRSWLGTAVRLLRCSGRCEKWHTPNRSATPSEMLETENEELDFSWLTSSGVSKVFKVLLVFSWEDQQFEILIYLVRKLGWSVSVARNAEEASEFFLSCYYDLVIIDRRSIARSQEADEICRILIERNNSRSCNIIALVKKTFFTIVKNDEEPMLYLLNIGYNKALMECSHKGILMNELIGIYTKQAQPKSQLAAAQLLYLIVDKCQDIIHVTNDQHIVQYVNKASETLLGFNQQEIIGRKIQEVMTFENFALVYEHLRRGREYRGNVDYKKKPKGSLNIKCRVLPFNIPISASTYYVYRCDITRKYESISSSVSFHNFTGHENNQTHERQSFEWKTSQKPRRSTVSKLHNLLLDSPITKVISLLSSAGQRSVDRDVSAKIEAAIQILTNTELYTPQLREDDPLPVSNPIISGLLESLISVSTNDTNKSSNTSVRKLSATSKVPYLSQHYTQEKLFKYPQEPQEIQELLESNFNWNFDIFKLETLTNRRPLFFLGMALMSHYRVAEKLECDEKTLQNWLMIIEANYNVHISYHNSTHATDVLQAIACFMRSKRLQKMLDPLDEVAALLAAVSHDIGHPGKSSQFLCNANNKLAILYNDLSVLESHHSALTFKLTLSDDNVNIFKNLKRDVYKSIRHDIIDMILATEMTKHFEHLAKFVNIFGNTLHVGNEDFIEDATDAPLFLLPENVALTKRMMLKCADVTNPTRPFRFYVEWTKRIAEEYFNQTDEEKRKNMPVVMPMFDKASCSIPKLQIGFVDYIINDMMEAWDAFINMPEIIGNMKQNYEKWKEFQELGITTLQDIKKIQETPELQIYKKQLTI